MQPHGELKHLQKHDRCHLNVQAARAAIVTRFSVHLQKLIHSDLLSLPPTLKLRISLTVPFALFHAPQLAAALLSEVLHGVFNLRTHCF